MKKILKLKFWVWLTYVVIAVLTYVLAITLFGISFDGTLGIGTHLAMIVFISVIAFSPLWFNEVMLTKNKIVRHRYLILCSMLQGVVLIGLVQSESLFSFFSFSIPLGAIGIYVLLNILCLLSFSVLVNRLINNKIKQEYSILEKPFEDLLEAVLNRKTIQINENSTSSEYQYKTVLITGAAGFIGSELARQLAMLNCKKVILLDQTEAGLHALQQDFSAISNVKVVTVIGDIRDVVGAEQLFKRFEPEIVFHAAAYKQVPLMEEQPYEAIRTNICGTKNLVDLSLKYQVKKFILISTDKAVNPTTVLGATKRLSELYCNAQQQNTGTRFITTRFGNVFGSSGSVIPLFQKQIKSGGPVAVTHKEVKRFFMAVSEACHLVLEAGTIGNGGEIFIFEMGEQIKILDLAQRMIKLSGLTYPKDIDIVFIGLRPGEKMEEELWAKTEDLLPTHHDKIKIATSENVDKKMVIKNINALCKLNNEGDAEKSLASMKHILEAMGEARSN